VARSDAQLSAAALQDWAANEMAPYQVGSRVLAFKNASTKQSLVRGVLLAPSCLLYVG
jgi:hypothetical protein